MRKNCTRPGEQLRRIPSYEDGSLKKRISKIFNKGEEDQMRLWSFRDGHAEEMPHVNSDGKAIEELKIVYSFDDRGNWIYKKLKSLNATYVISREVKYRK